MKSVCISGASGFIGRNLVQRLLYEGFTVTLISREDFKKGTLGDKIKQSSIVINLSGESIAGFWTKRKRKRIYDSRIQTAKELVEAINQEGLNVKLLIQVSAVGIYDNHHIHTEDSKYYDEGFLSMVIRDWEDELTNLRNYNLRVVILRLGVVLDKSGGILQKMMYTLKMGIGIGVRSEEYFPFVQLDDLMNVFLFCIKTKKIFGVVNVSAPFFSKISQFFSVLVRIEKVRCMIWFNKRLIGILLGKSGSLLTNGQRVVPEKLENEGFVFRYDNIEVALNRACN